MLNTGSLRLICRHQNALAGGTQKVRQFFVQRRNSLASVYHPDQGYRIINRKACLLEDVCRNYRFVVGDDAAGIDNREALAAPVHLAVDSVAGNTGFVSNNRTPLPDQSVE